LIIFAGFYAYDQYKHPVNTPENPVTMANLLGAYMDNPTTADSLYAGKIYYVTGVPISLQIDPSTGQYYSDLVFNGFVQFYWKDSSQASQVTPCTPDTCQPILAKCTLTGFSVKSGGNDVIMLNDCEFIRGY